MSATEELRILLDERGVEHSDHYLNTTWRDGHGILHLAGEPMADGSLVVDMLTPEQAITATLGGDKNRISERLRGVASDMRNIGASSMTPHELFAYWAREVDKAADLADFMCGENYVKQSTLGGGTLTADDVLNAVYKHGARWQAIAATLGCGECEQVIIDCDDGLMPPFTAHCSKCGAEWGFTPKFCPECGAKVAETRDERKAVKR